MKGTILDRLHYLLYFLTPAMNPRFLVTMDTDLQPLSVNTRVGQAVETVGQAGRPKTISGFQTHTTPVLLAHRDRAELASQEYVPLATVLEDVVILEKVPDQQPVSQGSETAGTK
jgi:26S proteasome regulatory subunit N1